MAVVTGRAGELSDSFMVDRDDDADEEAVDVAGGHAGDGEASNDPAQPKCEPPAVVADRVVVGPWISGLVHLLKRLVRSFTFVSVRSQPRSGLSFLSWSGPKPRSFESGPVRTAVFFA